MGASKAFLGRKLKVNSNIAAPVRVRSTTTVCAAAEPDRPLWFPGSTPPPWLDGSLPGDFGFDPLGLCKFNQYTNFLLLNWIDCNSKIKSTMQLLQLHSLTCPILIGLVLF